MRRDEGDGYERQELSLGRGGLARARVGRGVPLVVSTRCGRVLRGPSRWCVGGCARLGRRERRAACVGLKQRVEQRVLAHGREGDEASARGPRLDGVQRTRPRREVRGAKRASEAEVIRREGEITPGMGARNPKANIP